MGYAGQKTITTIETDAMVVDEPEVEIDYSNNLTTWASTLYKPMNNQGISAITISGNAFKVNIRFAEIHNNTRISYIKVRFKMTDLRGMRGVYAPPTSFRGQGA
jgi:archaellum component FlaG (FlaF/FlaG flagellin family)